MKAGDFPWIGRGTILPIVAAAVISALIFANFSPPQSSARRGGGRLFWLDHVTYGTTHAVLSGPSWLKWLQGKLPAQIGSRLGKRVEALQFNSYHESLVLWLSVDPMASTNYHPRWSRFTIEGGSGQTFGALYSPMAHFVPDRRVAHFTAYSHYRREPRILVNDVVDGFDFSYALKKPASSRPFPEWEDRPLDTTNFATDCAVRMGTPYLDISQGRLSLSAPLRFTRGDQDVTDQFRYVQPRADATGNHHYLPTDEPAWRMNLKLSRTANSPWQTNEYFEFKLDELRKGGEAKAAPHDLNKPYNRESYYQFNRGDWKYSHVVRNDWFSTEHEKLDHSWHIATGLFDSTGMLIRCTKNPGSSSGPVRLLDSYRFSPPDFSATADHDQARLLPTITNYHQGPFTVRMAVGKRIPTGFVFDPRPLPRAKYLREPHHGHRSAQKS